MAKKLSKDKRDRLILVGVATTAVAVGVVLGIIKPQGKAFERTAALIAEQKTKVHNGERLVKSTAEITKRYEAANQRLRTVEATMASGDMYSWVIATINQLKDEHKVEIPQYSREVICEVGLLAQFPYRAAAFQLRGTAYYDDLGRFVANVENKFPHMRVQNLEMEPVGGPGSGTAGNTAIVPADPEKLNFRLEIVALVNPTVAQR